jgi:23S rRNA G2445 N2-methylase RlmL
MKKAGKIKEVGEDAHHLFPQKFRPEFKEIDIVIDNPEYGIWMKQSLHRKYAKAYNKLWKRVLDAGLVNNNNAMMFAKEFMLEAYDIVI